MGWPLRRREARLLQGRAELLLSGLVGTGPDDPFLRQQGRMGQVAQDLSVGLQGGRPRGERHHDVVLRRQEPAGTRPPAVQRRQAARLPRRRDEGRVQGGVRVLQRGIGQESGVRQDLCLLRQVPENAERLVRCRRGESRPLRSSACAATSGPATAATDPPLRRCHPRRPAATEAPVAARRAAQPPC